jgi:hypothetical protein
LLIAIARARTCQKTHTKQYQKIPHYFNLDFKGKLNINENGNYSAVIIKRLEIENKLILMGIEGIDIDVMIDKLVVEYNK